jgi:hypothetical protein
MLLSKPGFGRTLGRTGARAALIAQLLVQDFLRRLGQAAAPTKVSGLVNIDFGVDCELECVIRE